MRFNKTIKAKVVPGLRLKTIDIPTPGHPYLWRGSTVEFVAKFLDDLLYALVLVRFLHMR
jgi:hypothetical protein